MIENNFYETINELFSRASSGTITDIVDYDTFIEAGKQIASMTDADSFKNAFISQLANKIRLTIDTARKYTGAYSSMTRGQLPAGGIIELITHKFYEARAAAFVKLTNDGTVDQYIINKGDANVRYYTDSNAYQIPVTVQSVELEGAFRSPEAMQSFINNQIEYAMNSNEANRELGRLGIMGKIINDLSTATAATGAESPAQRYKLVTLFNSIYGANTVDADNCLYNGEFIRFACMMINKVAKKMQKVSTSYNTSGIKTFTPAGELNAFINSALVSGVSAYILNDDRRPEYNSLPEGFEDVPYWQNEDDPFVVSSIVADYFVNTLPASGTASKVYYNRADGKHYEYKNSDWSALDKDDEDDSAPVVALLMDKYAAGEYVEHQRVVATPYNARGEYYNNWINAQIKYIVNEDANAVIFTLE